MKDLSGEALVLPSTAEEKVIQDRDLEACKETGSERNASESSSMKEGDVASIDLSDDEPKDLSQSQLDSPIPDGGLYAWLQVLSGFMLYFNSWGMVTAFGVFQDYYSRDLLAGENNSTIAWIGTMQGFLLAFSSIFAGPVLDRGHPHWLILCGGAFVVTGLMLTSLCHTYWQLMLAQGVCVGIGAGQLFIVAVAVLPGWFQKRRAIATGLAATGSSVGGIVFPIVFHQLEPKIGFGCTVRMLGFVAMGTTLISLAIARMRTRPPPRPKIIDFSGFREPLFVLFASVSFVGAMGLYVPFFFVIEYAGMASNMSGTLAFFMLPIISAGSILGRTLPALVADKYGCLKVLTSTTAVSMLLAFCWTAVSNTAGIIVWSLLYGAFSGAFVSLQTPTVAAITPDIRMVGGRMGMNNFCLALGVLVGNPIAGVIREQGSWIGLQVFCGATLGISSILTAVTWAVLKRTRKA